MAGSSPVFVDTSGWIALLSERNFHEPNGTVGGYPETSPRPAWRPPARRDSLGSEARQEATPESDVDLLVLLDGPIAYWDDLRANIEALYPLILAIERPIHARPVDIEAYEAGEFPLFRIARKEGIVA